MVLEEAVILETHAANAAEHMTFHKTVGVRTELLLHMLDRGIETKGLLSCPYSVNNVVVVPNVNLRNGGICSRKWASTEPANVVLEVVLVAFYPKLFFKWILTSLVRI